MTNGRSAEILLKLLDRVPDGHTLEILLEPENLLTLLQNQGDSKDDVRQKLKSGVLPGELLLALLDREPDTARLLAQLGSSGAAAKADPAARQARAVSGIIRAGPSKKLFGDYYLLAVLVIIMLTAIVPALAVTGFLSSATLSREVGTLIALVGGAVAGAIASPRANFSWKGIIVGIVYGVGTLWATILYTQARSSILKIEIAVPLLIGAIPAVIVYLILSRLPRKG